MKHEIEVRLAALKLIRDWSTGLLVIQSAAIGVVGTFLATPVKGWLLCLVAALFATLITSIYVGAVCVVGTIPYIAQSLVTNPGCNIYEQRGGLAPLDRKQRATLGMFCIWQANLFIVSLILFAVFAIYRG